MVQVAKLWGLDLVGAAAGKVDRALVEAVPPDLH